MQIHLSRPDITEKEIEVDNRTIFELEKKEVKDREKKIVKNNKKIEEVKGKNTYLAMTPFSLTNLKIEKEEK